MLKYIQTYIIAVCILIASTLNGQELGLHFMENVWQSSKTNPAFMTSQKVVFSFPSIFVNHHNTVASYNDVVFEQEGQKVLDLDPVISRMDDYNFVRNNVDVDLVNLSFGTKLWRVSLGHSIKYRSMIGFSRDLVDLGWNGNASLMGRQVDIGPDAISTVYGELSAGFAINLIKLSVGGRIKLLSGLFDASTGSSVANVQTDSEYYQTTFTTDYELNIASVASHGGIDDFDFDLDNVSVGDAILGKNFGVALDIGVQFRVNEKLTVAASFLDIGQIKWKTNTNNYTSRGTYTYDGLDLNEVIEDGDDTFEGLIDTLEQIFDFEETSNSYTTALPAKAYFSAQYKVNPILRVGGLVYAERFRGEMFTGIAANATADLGKMFSFGLVYSVFKSTYSNVGVNAMLKLGPVQLFGVTDNVLAAFNPLESRNVNARVGMNLAFK